MYTWTAENLYSYVRSRGQRGRIWAALCGRSRRLRPLAEVEASYVVHERHCVGVRSVPIDQIRGSEGRSTDFDRSFCPLQDRTRERWLGIARARQADKSLPPVLLVQVGEVYYVRDGHHRISVARALGQRTMEAKVTVWQVSERAGTALPEHPGRRVRTVAQSARRFLVPEWRGLETGHSKPSNARASFWAFNTNLFT